MAVPVYLMVQAWWVVHVLSFVDFRATLGAGLRTPGEVRMNRALPPIAVVAICLTILALPATARADEPAGPAAAPAPAPIVPAPILLPAPLPTHVRSGWLIAGGAVTMAGGLATAGMGGVLLAFAESPWSLGFGSPDPTSGNPLPRSDSGVVGSAALIAGGVFLFGGGVVMTVFGAQRVPDAPAARAGSAALPTVAIGPRGGTLTWSF